MSEAQKKFYSIKPLCYTERCAAMTAKQKLYCYTSETELFGENGTRKQPGVCYQYHVERRELDGGELNPGNIAMSGDGMRGSGVEESGGRMGHTRPRRMGR